MTILRLLSLMVIFCASHARALAAEDPTSWLTQIAEAMVLPEEQLPAARTRLTSLAWRASGRDATTQRCALGLHALAVVGDEATGRRVGAAMREALLVDLGADATVAQRLDGIATVWDAARTMQPLLSSGAAAAKAAGGALLEGLLPAWRAPQVTGAQRVQLMRLMEGAPLLAAVTDDVANALIGEAQAAGGAGDPDALVLCARTLVAAGYGGPAALPLIAALQQSAQAGGREDSIAVAVRLATAQSEVASQIDQLVLALLGGTIGDADGQLQVLISEAPIGPAAWKTLSEQAHQRSQAGDSHLLRAISLRKRPVPDAPAGAGADAWSAELLAGGTRTVIALKALGRQAGSDLSAKLRPHANVLVEIALHAHGAQTGNDAVWLVLAMIDQPALDVASRERALTQVRAALRKRDVSLALIAAWSVAWRSADGREAIVDDLPGGASALSTLFGPYGQAVAADPMRGTLPEPPAEVIRSLDGQALGGLALAVGWPRWSEAPARLEQAVPALVDVPAAGLIDPLRSLSACGPHFAAVPGLRALVERCLSDERAAATAGLALVRIWDDRIAAAPALTIGPAWSGRWDDRLELALAIDPTGPVVRAAADAWAKPGAAETRFLHWLLDARRGAAAAAPDPAAFAAFVRSTDLETLRLILAASAPFLAPHVGVLRHPTLVTELTGKGKNQLAALGWLDWWSR